MAGNLIGVPIPSLDWKSANLPDEFRKFKRSCEFIFKGPLKDETEEVKVQYLLMWVGPDGADIRDSWQLATADESKLNIHWQKFESYVRPKSNFRVARFQLRALKQDTGETIDSFLTRAKVILAQCNYSNPQEMLLDTLISGVNSETVQRKLIGKDESLTVDKALDIIRTFESTQSQMSDIQDTRKVHALSKSSGGQYKPSPKATNRQPFKSGICWNCGNPHGRNDNCPAADVVCHDCGKVGHFGKMCLSKNNPSNPWPRQKTGRKGHKKFDKRKVHEVVEEGQPSDEGDGGFGFDMIMVDSADTDDVTNTEHHDSITIESVSSDIIRRDQAFANIGVNKSNETVTVKCKIDTGAQSNVMPVHVFGQLFPQQMQDGTPIGLTKTGHVLSAYGGARIRQYGICNLTCEHDGSRTKLPFFVTDAPGHTMLGLRASMELGLVTLNCQTRCITCHDTSDIEAVISQHPDPKHPSHTPYGAKNGDAKQDVLEREPECFTFDGVGTLPGSHHMTLKADAESRIHPPNRIPEALRDPFKKELNRMVKGDIVRKVDEPTDWVSNVVCVTKSNGQLRICLDPKDLNRALKREHHYTPTLDDILPRLSKAKVFSILDARCGYWNVKLDKESQLLTTFNTPFGRYCFKRLPFGVISAQDVFQKKMDTVIEGLESAASISDDVLVWGDDESDHDNNLYDTLQQSKKNGVLYNIAKCHIKQPQIKFYGNIISKDGMAPDPQKVNAIANMPVPTSKQELRSVLGMVNYLSRFTPNLAHMTSPLRELTKDDVDYQWLPEHETAFKNVKDIISSTDVLAFFDGTKAVTVQTDASMKGLGATLLQEGRPVAYASKSLSAAESNYSNIEREMLGVVFGLTRFHHYVYARKVRVETDHKPLESISKKNLSQAPPRLQRMLLKIQPYDYEIKYVPGKDIPVADALSRSPLPDSVEIPDMNVIVHEVVNTSESRLEQIRRMTSKDPALETLKSVIQSGWPDTRDKCPSETHEYWNYRDELGVHDGVIVKGHRIVIPKCLQPEVLQLLHAGHQGIVKCRLRARNTVFWCGINKHIDDMIQQCSACQHNQSSQQQEPLMQLESQEPWQVVGTDLFHWNRQDYLLVVDYYSNFPIVRKLSSTNSVSVVNSLRSIFAEYCVPETLISDNGPQYSSSNFAQFAKKYGFKHITSSPHYPQSNGKSERFVGVVKKTLQKALESGEDAHMAMLCLRTTPIGPRLPSPAELIFGRKVRSNLPVKSIAERDEDLQKDLRELRSKAMESYDSHSKPLADLKPGQSVRVQDPITKRWKPATIEAREPEPRSYLVKHENGAIHRRNRRHIRTTGETFHANGEEEIPTDIPEDTKRDVPAASQTETAPGMSSTTGSPAHHPEEQPPGQPYVTRYGRTVKPRKILDL